MEIKAKRHEEQQRELEEEEENSVRNYPQKLDFFFFRSQFYIILAFSFKYVSSTDRFIIQMRYIH